MTNNKVASYAERLATLTRDYKADLDTLKEQAEKAGIDFGGIRRLVAWQGKDAVKRAEQEAIDHQYRFLAGDVDEPATLPSEGHLSQAVRFYAANMSVRQVADVLKVSVGKAHKLKTLAALFSVHGEMNVNATPPHDPETGEINNTEVDSSGAAPAVRSEPSRPAEQSVNAGPPPGSDEPDQVTAKGDTPAPITESCEGGSEQEAARSSGTASGSLLHPAPQDPITDNSDGMDIPLYLRRPLQGDGAGR